MMASTKTARGLFFLYLAVLACPVRAQQGCVVNNASSVTMPGTPPGPLSVACGNATSAGEGGTSIGYNAAASVSGTIGVGWNAQGTGVNGVAVGTGANAQALNSIAMGMNSYGNGANSISIGAGAANNAFANSVALGAWTYNSAPDQVAIGGRTLGQVGAGDISAASTDAINGAQLFDALSRVLALEATSLQQGTLISQSGQQAGDLAAALRDQEVSLSAMQSRVNDLAAAISGHQNVVASAVDSAAQLQRQSSDMKARLEQMSLIAAQSAKDLAEAKKENAESAAVAIAMAGSTLLPDRAFSLSGNVGTYRGKWAGSLQFGVMLSSKASISGGVARSLRRGGSVGARAGFTLGW